MFLLDLAPGGGCLAAALLQTPVVSCTTISPLPSPQLSQGRVENKGGIFLWPDPISYPIPGVTRHHALWSADFPRRNRSCDAVTRSTRAISSYTDYFITSIMGRWLSTGDRWDEIQYITRLEVCIPGFRQGGYFGTIQESMDMSVQFSVFV